MIEMLADVMLIRGIPEHIRSDNGPEFIAQELRNLQACGVGFPFAMLTSICRSIVTICSGLYLLIGMTSFSSKWIFSHSTWYKNPRSRQNAGAGRGASGHFG